MGFWIWLGIFLLLMRGYSEASKEAEQDRREELAARSAGTSADSAEFERLVRANRTVCGTK
jgi:hypothetical protein